MASKFEFVNLEKTQIMYYGNPKMLIAIHIDSALLAENAIYEKFEFILGSIWAEWNCTKQEREREYGHKKHRKILKKTIKWYIDNIHDEELTVPIGNREYLAGVLIRRLSKNDRQKLKQIISKFTCDYDNVSLKNALDLIRDY